jgi:hypothetical protein
LARGSLSSGGDMLRQASAGGVPAVHALAVVVRIPDQGAAAAHSVQVARRYSAPRESSSLSRSEETHSRWSDRQKEQISGPYKTYSLQSRQRLRRGFRTSGLPLRRRLLGMGFRFFAAANRLPYTIHSQPLLRGGAAGRIRALDPSFSAAGRNAGIERPWLGQHLKS